jgi:ubiquinone/menaquinone biosynthesis C-methylase UbiE
MATAESRWGEGANAEAIEAWDGPLYDRFVRFRHIVTTGLGAHGEEALRLVPPQPGQRVLDIGCGFGDTTQRIAELVGPEGEAVGVDAAERFIETAKAEAAEAGVANARFFVADVQSDSLGEGFDLAFSRMGTMFFASPVAALRNVREALVPGGRLAMVVWRRRIDNDWLYRAQQIVEGIVERPEEYDEPTCGPGPFSMADEIGRAHV